MTNIEAGQRWSSENYGTAFDRCVVRVWKKPNHPELHVEFGEGSFERESYRAVKVSSFRAWIKRNDAYLVEES